LQDGCFPRFHRRGLIEGRDFPGFSGKDDDAVFRGFTAAASLKDLVVFLEEWKIRLFSAVSPPRPH